jgi:hypothetical protein
MYETGATGSHSIGILELFSGVGDLLWPLNNAAEATKSPILDSKPRLFEFICYVNPSKPELL